jgi:hypothetical protein
VPAVLVYALVSSLAVDEAVDVFVRRGDAESALADVVADEPDWVDVLTIVPLELDERNASPN